jgi:hypothetical protein
LKFECFAPLFVFDDHVRPQDVGWHQVRGELNAAEMQVERFGQRAYQHRFAQARDTFEQTVTANKQTRQHAMDDLVMANNRLAYLLAHGLVTSAKLVRLALHVLSHVCHEVL